jgi:hypothetical protein
MDGDGSEGAGIGSRIRNPGLLAPSCQDPSRILQQRIACYLLIAELPFSVR